MGRDRDRAEGRDRDRRDRGRKGRDRRAHDRKRGERGLRGDDDSDRHHSERNRRQHQRDDQGQAVAVELLSLEVAQAHDGPLRGAPEPVIILAMYGAGSDKMSLLERSFARLKVSKPYPSTSAARDAQGSRLELRAPEPYQRLLLLGIALERDSGKDVEALYAALADPSQLAGWTQTESLPDPLPLDELCTRALSTPPAADPLQLLRDGQPLEDSCKTDEWVGAAAVLVDLSQPQQHSWRLHFGGSGGRNDWTAVVRVRL